METKLDITVLTGVSAGDLFHFSLNDTTPLVVGRATECDLVLQDPLVSRKHLNISLTPQGVILTDLGSTHGTFHMGFQLKAGPDGARRLADNDEFKIGELLFRVNFDESIFKAPDPAAKPGAGASADGQRKRRMRLLIGACLGAVLLLLLLPDNKGRTLPVQKGNEVLILPAYGLTGYTKKTSSDGRGGADFTHLDKAQFELPASNVVIEYEYTSEGPLTLKIDDVTLDELTPTDHMWRPRQLIVRGLALGVQRRLIFDNPDFPRPAGKSGPFKEWAVRDVRQSPLSASFGADQGVDSRLQSCIALVEAMDKSPAGLFALERGLQTTVVELLNEAKVDALDIDIDLGSDEGVLALATASLTGRLQAIQHERAQGAVDGDKTMHHLKDLASMIGQVDAELWRRVNSRISQARLAAKMKTPIDAYDALTGGMSLFPAEDDYRWTLLNRLYLSPKIVPQRVRDNPDKFRPRDR